MSGKSFGEALCELMTQRAIGVRALAREVPCNPGTISKLCRDERGASEAMAKRLDAILGSDGRLLTLYKTAARTRRIKGNASAVPRVNVEPSAPSHTEDDDVKRREMLYNTAALTAGATVAPVLAVLTQAWQDSEPSLPGASVSRAMIDDWEDAVVIHSTRARVEPPHVVLAALAADFSDMAPHLARTQPDAIRRDLAHAAASHALLIAGKLVDLGNCRESRRWWSKTHVLADRSGDSLLASWVRSREALYRRGDPTENLADLLGIAREARRLAGHRPSAPLVSALTAEAQILARMGHPTHATSALKSAEAVFDKLSGVSAFVNRDWARREEGLWFDKSLIYTLARDVKKADEAQDVLLHEKAEDLTSIQVRLHRAALLAANDPKRGLEEASRLVDSIPAAYRRTRFMTAARMTLEVVPRHAAALPAARELRALTTR